MTIILVQQIYKTFFFLRIFDNLSYIVTMITTVIIDLKVFLIFYAILLFLFSMIFATIGLANKGVPGGLKDFVEKKNAEEYDKAAEDLRMATRHLGKITGKVDVEEILGSVFNDFCIGK